MKSMFSKQENNPTIKTITYNEKYVDDNGNELVTNDNVTA